MSDLKIEVPQVDPLFIPFGCYESIVNILSAKLFFPIMIDGPTGVGKTFLVEQACANLGREFMRVNITNESDEDSLFGGIRLLGGDTVFQKGAVPLAMERGAVLLLDEIDLANHGRIMCLQSVLEGKGYFIKRNKEWVQPAPGFNVIATANTKGVGDVTGTYIGTQILNEAFLERFSVSYTQNYPDKNIERNILNKVADFLDLDSVSTFYFIKNLTAWAEKVRRAIAESDDKFQHTISTRRLVHILKAFSILKSEEAAMDVCLNRFDEHHKKSFIEFYNATIGTSIADDPEDFKSATVKSFDFASVTPF